MLKISAGSGGCEEFCDGIARRDFIRIGAMGIGGLTMANILESEAKPASAPRTKRSSIFSSPAGRRTRTCST